MTSSTITVLHDSLFDEYLTPRPRDSHKGHFGHLLIIGGDYGFSGAVQLAAIAALRTGVGLVSVATRKEHALTLNIQHPEIMCHGVTRINDCKTLIEKASAIVIGPGLGQSRWATPLLALILKTKKPCVIDADGLNLLATFSDNARDHWILTPHPGEASRLLKTTIDEIQAHRIRSAHHIQKKYGGVCILKGHGTVIAGPDQAIARCDQGNPGMASAGMGDLLSGMVGALLAQSLPLTIAAQLGVFIHANAGDLAAKIGERGMIASDLLPYIRPLMNRTTP